MTVASEAVALSVVAAAHNEQDNVAPLVDEIVAALGPTPIDYEIVIVDDGSTDGTLAVLTRVQAKRERLRVIRMLETPPDRGHGQSAAFRAGLRAARGELIALLDADGQNDPADIPGLLEKLRSSDADMVQGDRWADRRDSLVRRVSSRVGQLFRRWLTGDTIRDTGCSLRVMRRDVALALPLEFRGMHRFIPLTARQLGYRVIEVPVHHRRRRAGRTKYGIRNRAIPGLIDCFAVRWMRRRRRPIAFEEVRAGAEGPSPTTHTKPTRAEATT
ncbi:MAG: glycosyltransferase family 2 protein [Planctomycetota bacterium]|jgi:glycosyltransferase involved in cell wall biosynthesis